MISEPDLIRALGAYHDDDATPRVDDLDAYADLHRGRQAVVRRRRAVAGLAAVAASIVLVGTAALALPTWNQDGPAPANAPTTQPTASFEPFPTTVGGDGFTLEYVPSGWHVRDYDPYSAYIERDGEPNPGTMWAESILVGSWDPHVEPPIEGPNSSFDVVGPEVVVQGQPAVFFERPTYGDDEQSQSLAFQTDGKWIEIVVYDKDDLSQDDMVRLAEGVSLTSDFKELDPIDE